MRATIGVLFLLALVGCGKKPHEERDPAESKSLASKTPVEKGSPAGGNSPAPDRWSGVVIDFPSLFDKPGDEGNKAGGNSPAPDKKPHDEGNKAGGNSPIPSEPKPVAPPIEVSMEELVKDYHVNQFAADKKYKDKRLRIKTDAASRAVEQIGRDPETKSPFLASSSQLAGAAVDGRYPYARIVWGFQSADDPGVLAATPRGWYIIEGECLGRMDAAPPELRVLSAEFYILFRRSQITPQQITPRK